MNTDSSGMVNAYVEGAAELAPEERDMIDRRKTLLGPAYRLMYERPLHLVRGDGLWLYDAAGQAYMDAYNNVTSIGHCHPKVVEAITNQMATLATNTRYLHETVLEYAERLLATMPDEIGNFMFTCTGSDANDLATRIAQSYTGGTGIIVTETAYHGITQSVAAFSPSLGVNVPLGPHVRCVTAPDAWRSEGDVAASFAADVDAAIKDLQRHGIKPAFLICDAILASDGVFSHPLGVLKGAVDAIHAVGGLYIADEVQSGFGRTGDALWGFARHGVTPDLITMGKPMGNGYPVAGVAARPEVIAEFGKNARYFNTFGGNTVAATAALAVLDTIQRDGLTESARDVGGYFKKGIQNLAEKHASIGEVRGAGLFVGVDIVQSGSKIPDAVRTTRIVNGMRDEHILISACAKTANVLKIRPPLVFNRKNADHFVDVLDTVLTRVG